MKFHDVVQLNEHFKKSANLILDHDNVGFLKTYILSPSNQVNLERFVKFVDSGACAFNFSGPFGSGKSSFSLFISTLLEGKSNSAYAICVEKITNKELISHPLFSDGDVRPLISIVGTPESPIKAIANNLKCEANINSIKTCITEKIESAGRLTIIIDEMGKFLEQSAKSNVEDIFVFQELAELANNSKGKFIFIGIMHQSLADYAQGLSKSSHDEWLKISGRFQNFTINTSSEEQLDLISKAIIKEKNVLINFSLIDACVNTISINKAIQPQNYQLILQACWPLHPLVTLLLGPFSSKRFGQNQRSIFSFLNSQEAFGFQSFLRNQDFKEDVLYSPMQFWDYIKANFDFVLNASSDSKKWILAQESLDRCLAHFDDRVIYDVLKVICLIDLFKGNSGLSAYKEVLEACFPNSDLNDIIEKLKKLAIIRETHDKKSLVLFEGSDFDLDAALASALEQVTVSDFQRLNKIAAFQPIVAKRYYHVSGTIRWMNMFLVPVDVWKSNHQSYLDDLNNSMFGSFVILIPKDQESFQEINKELNNYESIYLDDKPIIISVISDYNELNRLSHELIALEWIEKNTPSLLGDRTARAEIEAHKNSIIQSIYTHINDSYDGLEWHGKNKIGYLTHPTMSRLCSELAGKAFPESINVRSEMLNTNKPSSNANAAINALLRRMVLGDGKDRLGIEGHPAEWGVFRSVLEANQIYFEENSSFGFHTPNNANKLADFWEATAQYLKTKNLVSLKDLYSYWSASPFGVKKGLHALLLLAYLLSNNNTTAVYLKGMYQPEVTELFVDYLIKESIDIEIKYVDFNPNKKAWLENFLEALKDNHHTQKLFRYVKPNTLDTSRKLVAFISSLNPWVMRTKTLSRDTMRLRDQLKSASDPNKLIFEDIVKIYRINPEKSQANSFDGIIASLNELYESYLDLINDLGRTLFTSLQINTLTPNLEEIQSRAEAVFKSSGDFRIDALATRLKTFDLSHESIAGIASLAANKPINDWIDLDVERAHIEIASLCDGFKKAEIYTHLKGKSSKRQSYAVISSSNGLDRINEFSVLSEHHSDIDRIKNMIVNNLPEDSAPEIILAAMAELSLEFDSKIGE